MSQVNDINFTEWFRDAATRCPEIAHVQDDPEQQRFFEMEWDEMMQSRRNLSNEHFTLILLDYKEKFNDNKGEYYSNTPVLQFLVIRSVDAGVDKKPIYNEARRIAMKVLNKMVTDSLSMREECEADVPEGVYPPKEVDLGSLTIDRVQPEEFISSYGVLFTIKVLTDHETVFRRPDSDTWTPLS